MKMFFLMALSLVGIIARAGDLASLEKNLFIGQGYPSGNVYLKPWKKEGSLPKQVVVVALEKNAFPGSSPVQAQWKEKVEPTYLPEKEAVAEPNEICSPKNYVKKEKYLSSEALDYFDRGSFDNCTKQVADRYEVTDKPSASTGVLAFSGVSPSQLDYSASGKTTEAVKGTRLQEVLRFTIEKNTYILSRGDRQAKGHQQEIFFLQNQKAPQFHTEHQIPRGAL